MNPHRTSKSCILARVLPSDLSAVDDFCHEAREMLCRTGLSSQIFPLEMLLRESLNNAVIHGNCGCCEKRVGVEVRIGRKWIVVQVSDEGKGFSFRKAKRTMPGPCTIGGRGLAVYHMFAQRVSYNSTGSRVCLWRAVTGEKGS